MWFSLSAQDNHSYMWSGVATEPTERLAVCSSCGFKTAAFAVNPNYVAPTSTWDLGCTFDNYFIASPRFRAVVEVAGLTGYQFIEVAEESAYVLTSQEIVRFDAQRRHTRFQNRCEVCGYFESVAGATPAFLLEEPAADFVRTDVLFGSGNERSPLLIVSTKAKQSIEQAQLRGPEFRVATV